MRLDQVKPDLTAGMSMAHQTSQRDCAFGQTSPAMTAVD
jgi:hypothetical protein